MLVDPTKDLLLAMQAETPADAAALYKEGDRVGLSLKLDGIRAYVGRGRIPDGPSYVLYSREHKPIPNKHLQAAFATPDNYSCEGELVAVERYGTGVCSREFGETQGVVMSFDKTDPVNFVVFGFVGVKPTSGVVPVEKPAIQAMADALSPDLTMSTETVFMPSLVVQKGQSVAAVGIQGREFLMSFEEAIDIAFQNAVDSGYEGLMLRKLGEPYKFGRASKTNPLLVKIKPPNREGYKITGYNEELDKNGKAKGRLGSLQCVTPKGESFKVGTGFDAKLRDELWARRDELPGKEAIVTFANLTPRGVPRFPSFKAIREIM